MCLVDRLITDLLESRYAQQITLEYVSHMGAGSFYCVFNIDGTVGVHNFTIDFTLRTIVEDHPGGLMLANQR